MKKAESLLQNDPASQMLGIKIEVIKENSCTVSMMISENMVNGYDVCHGGLIFTLADTALAFCCAEDGQVFVSANANIDFIAPAKLGDKLIAEAQIKYVNGRNLYCDICVKNQNNELIALLKGRQVQMKETQINKS